MITLYGFTLLCILLIQAVFTLGGISPFVRVLQHRMEPLDFIKIPMCVISALALLERSGDLLSRAYSDGTVVMVLLNSTRILTFLMLIHALFLEKKFIFVRIGKEPSL